MAATTEDPDEVHYYATPSMTVEWRPALCAHSGNCVRGLPGVFAPKRRPWIIIADTSPDDMETAIKRCPSGALRFERGGAG